ncbi:MAG: hypothetical protein GC190_01270 [Alphaproteobacteria bacterium]|nr:hypothetical protein [Alphaproteobacteria bacterium]
MRWRWIGLGVAAVVVGAGAYYGWRTAGAAGVGAAAMAKVVCSCVFVDGRSLESCRADDPPGFEGIPVSIDEATKTATGTLFGIISRRAVYHDEFGCTLEP